MNKHILIKDIVELFAIVESGRSVVCNRVDTWIVNNEEKETLSKIWQFEKVSEDEYCYKTFDGYNRAIKHFFFMDSSKADRPISEYYNNFRTALCSIMFNIYGDEEMLLKLASKNLLNYNSYTLNYTNSELLEDRQLNRIYMYKFTIFKTRQILGSNKSGEEAIREVLNAHIATIYPNGIRHDEYCTLSSSSRADSVVFNKDSMHVYEIKSAKDSFVRLEKQIEDYRKYAERITLVMDIKKESAFIKNHAHKYKDVEVLFYYGPGTKFKRASRGKKLIPTTKKIDLLWKNELYEQVCFFVHGISKLSQFELVDLVSYLFTKKQAHDIVNEVLYTRHKKSIGKERMSRGDVDMARIFQRYQLDNSILQVKTDKFLYKYTRSNNGVD